MGPGVVVLCHIPAAVSQVSRIPKWQPKGIPSDTRTAINTEWGCYGSNLLPRVKEDLELDAASGPQKGGWLETAGCSMPLQHTVLMQSQQKHAAVASSITPRLRMGCRERSFVILCTIIRLAWLFLQQSLQYTAAACC
jgi:hypothetical protein